MMNVAEALKAADEKRKNGNWYPASGGTEQPFVTRTRRRLLYVFQPSTGRHAYLDLDQDVVLDDTEARHALATY